MYTCSDLHGKFIKRSEFKFLLLYNTYKRSLEHITKFEVCQSEPTDHEEYYYTKRERDFPARKTFYKPFSVLCKPFSVPSETYSILCKPLIVSGH